MPRPPVKRHTIFCHACPSPALLSTACAIVINNKKLNNKTEKTRGLSCLTPISAPSVLFRICYESFLSPNHSSDRRGSQPSTLSVVTHPGAKHRAIGLMCHSYKLLSMLVLHRMRDAVESRLAETQAGFHRERGCRDNVLLLRLLMDAVLRAGKQAVVAFIDYRAAFDTISHRFLDESLTAAGVQPKIRRIVKAIYAEATGMVRLRLPSGETLCSEPFPVRRGVIQGDIFSPQCFTLGSDRIFRLHDIAGQGIGGPSLGDVTASKLEYADDVGLLDWTAAEASERVSALARGSRTSASMEMSAPKSKGMHVHTRERLPVSTEEEVEALDLPHSCPECKMTFPTRRGLAVHRARWCRPGQRPAPDGASSLTKPSN